LLLAAREASWFVHRLMAPAVWPVIGVGLILFAYSAIAVLRRHYLASCISAAGQVVILLVGWGIAHRDYLVYPDVPLTSAAAPPATLRFILWNLPVGLAFVLPSLWLLFRTFKHEVMMKQTTPDATG